MSLSTRGRLLLAAERAVARSTDSTRHKAFVSYHGDDAGEVEQFLDDFGHTFIPRVIGVSDKDDFIDSNDTDYVMDRIRENYLTDSTVTIVLVGRCTWARRYVDWEIFSTLRNDKNNRRSGLMAVTLPSRGSVTTAVPPRLRDNLPAGNVDGYARWWKYPTTANQLRTCIDDAFDARSSRSHLIDNSRPRKLSSSPC